MEGTSFAAPIVASAAAYLLEANGALGPGEIREILVRTAHPVPGAAPERQGAGALEVGLAVSIALAERHRRRRPVATGPRIATGGVIFELHDDRALCVDVFGSWDQFTTSVSARSDGTGGWATDSLLLGPGEHHYKFRLDTAHWLADPCNPRRAHDGAGGLNSVFHLPAS